MKQIGDLKILTQAHYEREQQALKSLVAREMALRAELARLSEQEREARGDGPRTTPMRSIGADVLWLGWVGRTKEHLNLALAQILAQKEHHLARVRKAYGKVLVTDALAEKHQSAQRKARRDAQLEQAQECARWQ